MAAPPMVFTARYAAKHLGVDLDVIEELAEDMAPEDGRLSVINSPDDAETINASPAAVSTTSTSYSTTGGRTSWAKADPPRGFQRMDTRTAEMLNLRLATEKPMPAPIPSA